MLACTCAWVHCMQRPSLLPIAHICWPLFYTTKKTVTVKKCHCQHLLTAFGANVSSMLKHYYFIFLYLISVTLKPVSLTRFVTTYASLLV